MDYILEYYQNGWFTDEDMESFVAVGMITQEQYEEVKRNDKEIS